MILLRYIETGSEAARALNVIKMRNSDHDKGVYAFDIDKHGVTIGDKLAGISGVLGWTALRARS